MIPKGADIELQVAIDGSSSMDDPAAPGSNLSRWDVVRSTLPYLIEGTEKLDAQAEVEQTVGGATDDDKGGLWGTIYASHTHTVGDLNSSNWEQLVPTSAPGGGTHITLGYADLNAKYRKEFGDDTEDEKPYQLMTFLGDGEPQDEPQFERILRTEVTGKRHVVLGIVGYGREHDTAMAAYQRIAAGNPNVHVISFAEETDGKAIANAVLAVAGQA